MSIYEAHKRKQRVKNVGSGFLWFIENLGPWIAGVVIALLILWGIKGWMNSNDHDYAGYGPNNVEKHNYHALGEWVGYNAKQISRTHSRYANHKAWATQFAIDKKPVCVYVWGGANSDEKGQVMEGACH